MNPQDLPDPDQFRMRPEDRPRSKPSKKPPRHRPGEWFFKGPIPGEWLRIAMAQSIAATRVGIVIWYLAGCLKSRYVKVTWAALKKFGLSPDVGRRGVVSLERAGLVTVERHEGRCPVVTIMDVPAGDDHGNALR